MKFGMDLGLRSAVLILLPAKRWTSGDNQRKQKGLIIFEQRCKPVTLWKCSSLKNKYKSIKTEINLSTSALKVDPRINS